MAETKTSTYWYFALTAVLALLVGGYSGANLYSTVETVTKEIPVTVEVPVEVIKEVTLEVEVPADYLVVDDEKWYVLDITSLREELNDKVDLYELYQGAIDDFESELDDFDVCDGTDYKVSEMDVEDYDDVSLTAYDLDDDMEYVVRFVAEIEYDREVTCVWDVNVSYDEEGDVEVEGELEE